MRKVSALKMIIMATSMAVMIAGIPLAVPHPASALDNLLVNGILKSINYTSKTIVVDVKSGGCQGTRRFSVDHPGDLEGFRGKSLAFYINSSTCKGDKVYKIVRTKWEKKK